MRIIVSYRQIPQSKGWATGDSVVRAFRKLGHSVSAFAKSYELDEWVEDPHSLINQEYDLLVFCECNDGDRQYLTLKNIRAKTKVSWFFDTSYYPDNLTGLASYMRFDYNFIANPEDVNKFNNGHWLPYAADPELHFRKCNWPKQYDFSLVGSVRDDRLELVKQLKKRNIHCQLIGNIFRQAYVDILASSTCQINQNPVSGRGLLNMRVFEAPAAGSLLITQAGDYIDRILTHGTECFEYQSIDHLYQICEYIKNNPKEAEDMRITGQNVIMNKHTYEHRVKEMLEIINGN